MLVMRGSAHCTFRSKSKCLSTRSAMAAPQSIRYLLPLDLLVRGADDDEEEDDDYASKRSASADQTRTVEVYQQAKPLVHPRSSAAIKTLGKMLDDPELVRRMLQRTAHKHALEASDASRKHEGATASTRYEANHRRSLARLETALMCEEMVLCFDPQARQSRDVRLVQVKQLLAYYGLRVDDVAYRQWEQRLPEGTESVSVATLVQALQVWFSDKVLCEHFAAYEQSATSKHVTLETSSNEGGAHRGTRASNAPVLEKARSAPFLHPFTLLTQHNDATLSFDYDQCAKNPPVRFGCMLLSVCLSMALQHTTHAHSPSLLMLLHIASDLSRPSTRQTRSKAS